MARTEAPILANQILAAVSAIFTWAVKEELAVVNPCKLVDRNPTKDRERVLSDSEVPLFWKAFGIADPVIGAALKAILLTGQRPGEVNNMRREHIADGWWQMPGDPEPHWPGTKNGKSHRVWLPQAVQALIAEQGDGASGFAFAGPRGGPIHGLDAAMRLICTKLAIEKPVRPHDLRRSFLTKVTGLKFGRDAMDRIANHVEGKTTDIYDRHDYSDDDKDIMERVADHILALAEGRTAGAEGRAADNVRDIRERRHHRIR
jgi:integrase